MNNVEETNLPGYLVKRGKARDLYDLGDELLMVATDRISAFDVVLDDPIPDKGRVLTGLSAFWFQLTKAKFPNHFITSDLSCFPKELWQHQSVLRDRSMLVKKGVAIPVECVVRGYLYGSAWKEYQKKQTVSGILLPPGLKESEELPAPLFTPTTKATAGHDEPLTFSELTALIGQELAESLREISISLYQFGVKKGEESGIIIADTKFEFGWIDGELGVIDELFTPDSSRFWPRDQYQPGQSQPSFDKQFIRDYLSSVNWDYAYPPPKLPPEIISGTSARYREAYFRITGQELQSSSPGNDSSDGAGGEY